MADTDHPRSRGVYKTAFASLPSAFGSSPLARGLLMVSEPWCGLARIIPARAGFTCRSRSRQRNGPDHPRSRGVYSPLYATSPCSSGSSPLARGLHLRLTATRPTMRIIPARAGFTRGIDSWCFPSWDHPRSRGVYSTPAPAALGKSGSSPLARGLQKLAGDAAAEAGIIPARAGFTDFPSPVYPSAMDHPRSRGVYQLGRLGLGCALGSSPLARGLQDTHHDPAGRHRIIPARAGFTSRVRLSPRQTTDHPRSRGVYPFVLAAGVSDQGSSPLARGLRPRARLGGRGPGIIPARAGFTPNRR